MDFSALNVLCLKVLLFYVFLLFTKCNSLFSDNPLLLCEYCRVLKSQGNPRIKPIILDKISDLVSIISQIPNCWGIMN